MPAPTRFLAALVLALLAVVVPVTAGGTALAGPAFPGPDSLTSPDVGASALHGVPGCGATPDPTRPGPSRPDPGVAAPMAATVVDSGPDLNGAATAPLPDPVAAGPHATPTGRAAIVGASDSPAWTTTAPPGPVLDALLLPPSPTGADLVPAPADAVPAPDPGHDALADSRGPPAV